MHALSSVWKTFQDACSYAANLLFPLSSEFTNVGQNQVFNTSDNSKAKVVITTSTKLSLQGLCLGRIHELSQPSETLKEEDRISGNLQTGGQWHRFVRHHANGGPYALIREDIEIAYTRTCFCDWVRDEHSRQDWYAPLRSGRWYPPSGYLEQSEQDLVYTTSRRRLFTDTGTDNGYMGFCHQTCIAGDEVWIMMGADMPLILRRRDDGQQWPQPLQ